MAVKTIENIKDVVVGETYLTKIYFNAKTITYRPVVFESVEPTTNSNGHTILVCKPVIDDNFGRGNFVYVRENGALDKNAVKPIGNWVKNELKKKEAELEALTKEVEKLKNI